MVQGIFVVCVYDGHFVCFGLVAFCRLIFFLNIKIFILSVKKVVDFMILLVKMYFKWEKVE